MGDPYQLRHDNDIADDSHDNIEKPSAMPTSHREHLYYLYKIHDNPKTMQHSK